MNIFAFYNQIKGLLSLLYRAYGDYRMQLALLSVLGFLSGLLEAVGVGAVIPLFSFIAGGAQGTDIITKTIEAMFSFFNLTFGFRYLLIFIVVLFIVRSLALFCSNYIRIKIAAQYEEHTRSQLLSKTIQADWPYLLKQKLGYLETLLMLNVAHGERLLNTLASIVITLTGLAMYVLVAVNISLLTTIITCGLGALIFFTFKPLLRKVRMIAAETESVFRSLAHHVNQSLLGVKTIKAMSLDEHIIRFGNEYFSRLKHLKVNISVLRLIPDSMMQPLGIICVVIVFAISYTTTNFNLAAFAAVVYLIQRIFLYIQQLQTHMHVVSESAPYVEELLRIMILARQSHERRGGSRPFIFKDALEFNNISFSYSSAELNGEGILQDVTFAIQKGESVGLIGPSGSGKTTLVDLFLRLLRPTEGKILLDGVSIDDIDLMAWRKHIGYVSQDLYLANDTIRNNIRLYSKEITEDDILEAARMANVYDFADSLPDGLDTIIGDRGVMLSVGQRQRIVLARVLAQKPQILILDEATSALDTESERQVQKVIDGLRGRLTVLMVAHRLSTILAADRIMVLGSGRIIEMGKPKELLADQASYFSKVYKLASQ